MYLSLENYSLARLLYRLFDLQVIHMTWVCERVGTTWKKIFLSLKGSDVFLYETPPVSTALHFKKFRKLFYGNFAASKQTPFDN